MDFNELSMCGRKTTAIVRNFSPELNLIVDLDSGRVSQPPDPTVGFRVKGLGFRV